MSKKNNKKKSKKKKRAGIKTLKPTPLKKKNKKETIKVVETYNVTSDNIVAEVSIEKKEDELVLYYNVDVPELEEGTRAVLEDIRDELIKEITVSSAEILDIRSYEKIKEKFKEKIKSLMQKKMPAESKKNLKILSGYLLHRTLGLGNIEFLISDPHLEEIVINSSTEPVWIYHKKHGWMKTNIVIKNEGTVYNYASSIARKVGRTINLLDPLLDAHMFTGDRVNATLFPISSSGNTITIRKFRRRPFSPVELVENKTCTAEMMAFLWLTVESEVSMLFTGGTGSGKTTLMNAVLSLVPSNRRIISIEETREINIPKSLHWVPLSTREPNPEGKGEITMLDLLINSLRMRPDLLIVGEIRREREAEALFEAIHTGHSVYATFHADTAVQAVRRMTSEPINISPVMMESLPLIVTMYRQRKKGIRRVFEISELYGTNVGGREETINVNDLWKWNPKKDVGEREAESVRLFEELSMHTGMSMGDISKDLKEKREVIDYMIDKEIFAMKEVEKVINKYYVDKEKLLKKIRK